MFSDGTLWRQRQILGRDVDQHAAFVQTQDAEVVREEQGEVLRGRHDRDRRRPVRHHQHRLQQRHQGARGHWTHRPGTTYFNFERTFSIKPGELWNNLKSFLDNLLSLLSFVSQVVLYTFSKKDVLSEIACLEIPIIYEVSLDKNENSPNFDFHARPPLR